MFKVTEPGSIYETENGEWRVSQPTIHFLTTKELVAYSESHFDFEVETVKFNEYRSESRYSGLASGMRLSNEEERQTKKKLRKSSKG